MAYKVIIDAGHGGSDPGAVYKGREEKNDNLRLSIELGEVLEGHGLDVAYTRVKDVYNTPYEKAVMGNNSDADLFISIHRNHSDHDNKLEGSDVLVFRDEGFRRELARNINDELSKLGFSNNGVKERPNLVVLKKTKMPAVVIHVGYINHDKDNAIFDKSLRKIAEAIAEAILRTVSMPQKSVYAVQVGAYRHPDNAYRLLMQLRNDGYDAVIVNDNGMFKVQVGTFEAIDDAVKVERSLMNLGYDTLIVVK